MGRDHEYEVVADDINRMFDAALARVWAWEPAPCPVDARVLTRVDGEVYGDELDPLL